MAPFTKAEMMDEFREIVFQVARSASFSFGPQAAYRLLFDEAPASEKECWDIYDPENTAQDFGKEFAIEQISTYRAVEQFYDYGLLGIRNMLPLEDGCANEWTFAFGLIWDAANSFLITDITNGKGVTTMKCLHAARAFFARHILDGQKRTFLPENEAHDPKDMLTIREVAILSGLDERTVRNATNRNAANRLETASVESSIFIPRESAREWLSTKRGFTPSRIGNHLPKSVVLNGPFSGTVEAGNYIRKTRESINLSHSDLIDKANLNRDLDWIHALEEGLINGDEPELTSIGNALGLNGTLFALRMIEACQRDGLAKLQNRISSLDNEDTISSTLPNSENPEQINHGLEAVRKAFRDAGYKGNKETKKLSEFQSPSGQTIYVLNERNTLNRTIVMVHPALSQEALSRLDGVAEVGFNESFHAAMTAFPSRINNGKTPTEYGRQITINGLLDLDRFLNAFSTVTL
ncbi:MAG: hypothetical protein ACOYBW_09285 [Fluviibacter phosphoraccumulans]